MAADGVFMAFHVTQCPSCESTFNTSARVLESAAGKVRCGACLTVFEAEKNFVDHQPLHDNDADSVFVGNNPQDFFDPSIFLTRSALTESDESEAEPGSDSEKPSSDDFHKAIASGFTAEPAADANEVNEFEFPDSKPEHPDVVLAQFDQLTGEDSGQRLVDAESGQSELTETFSPGSDSATADDAADSFAAPDPSAESREKTVIEPPAVAARHDEPSNPLEPDSNIEPAVKPAGVSLSVSFTVDHSASARAALEEAKAAEAAKAAKRDTSELEKQSNQQAAQHLSHKTEDITQIESQPENEDHSASIESDESRGPAPAKLQDETLEIASDSKSPEANNDVRSDDHIESEPQTFIEAAPMPDGNQEIAADNLEHQFNQAIEEEDFQSSIEEGLDTTQQETDLPLDEEDELDNGTEPDLILEEPEEPETESAEIEPDSGSETGEETDEETEEESVEAIRARALRTELEDEGALEAIPEENLAALGAFSTPVELTAGKHRAWGQQIMLTLLILLMLGAMGAQYLWRNRQPLSQVANIRPLYEYLCERIDCEIPIYSDIDAIRSDNLAVRSHPDAANGLMVNVSFRNAAPFPQPFPVLVLGFNSVDNSVVALREFSPSEYLDPGLRNVELMPVMAPVQVNLEIVDPGPGAVNYTLAFRRP